MINDVYAQCVPRNKVTSVAPRMEMLGNVPPTLTAVSRARKELQAAGFQPFIYPAFEDFRYDTVMGGLCVFERLPGDELHLVRFLTVPRCSSYFLLAPRFLCSCPRALSSAPLSSCFGCLAL